jgi:SAM-dependent methyltransferase
VSFDIAASSYDRFMGRYSEQLTAPLADLAGVRAGQRALDVGCGPGALTRELVARLGAEAVSAVEPSPSFVAAARERHPDVAIEQASAEELPFADASFDAALAQLVVHFMRDPVAGLREMARVTRPGGAVAASVWDHAGDRSPITAFWRAARALEPEVHDESALAGARAGHLAELLTAAGLTDVEDTDFPVEVVWESFEDWWEPYTLGVGPAGAYYEGLDDDARAALRERCRAELGPAPFTVVASAWAARGVVR